ncbi:MAG: Gfo/Idh/MocA family oxidoreductase [Alphaproteobacteria bacterium]
MSARKNADPVRILILGTGAMAQRHFEFFSANPDSVVVAGIDRDPNRLAGFCEHNGLGQGFNDLEPAIAWGQFDAVANVTPDPVHKATTLRLAAAGLPVFCEKPLAENYADALEMTHAMETRGLINMVNLRYRAVPEIAQAAKMVAEGAIGQVRHVQAAYLQSWLVGNQWGDWRTEPRWLWRLSSRHGSKGVLGDIGIHILDTATFVSGLKPTSVHCRLHTFDKAEGNRIGDYELDINDSFVMSLQLEGGALAAIHASRFATGYANAKQVGVYGTTGGLEIGFESEVSSLRACTGDDIHTQTWRPVECPPVPLTYDDFVTAVKTGVNGEPSFRHAADLQRVLDLCFVSDADGMTHEI